jgi:D-3-phosphoglycerate dehydrogenase
MKILFIDTVHSILETRLIKMGFQCDMGIDLNRQDILSKIGNYQGLVLRSKTPIDLEFLEAAKQLKFIARSGAGIENIDLFEAEKREIQIFCAPEGNRQALGEHTLAMILSLFNKISIADKEIREGKWNRESNRGIELSGKTIGIVGYGNMGKAFAKCLSGFDCRVLAYDKHKKKILETIM